MKFLVTALLSVLVSVVYSESAESVRRASVYRIENGRIFDYSIRLHNTYTIADKLVYITVLGYVANPGIYYFDSSIGLKTILELAGSVVDSTERVGVMAGSEVVLYDINRMSELTASGHFLEEWRILVGGEVVYLHGLMGL